MADYLSRQEVWVIIVYMAAMMFLGAWFNRSSRDVEGYALGHRSMSGLVLGLSVLGTFTSSITFLSLPAKVFSGNWNVFVFGLALPPAALIATRYFVPLYRREVQMSAFELLERRFGYWARLYADLSYMVLQMIRTATIMLLVALAVRTTMGLPIIPTLLVSGVVVIVYDATGGIQADIWTDVVQVFVIVFGAGWALCELLFGSVDGPLEILRQAPTSQWSLGSWDPFDLANATVMVVFLYGLTENLRNYGTDQNYVQRMLSARSERAASGAIWLGALCYLPVSAIFCLIGVGLAVHYNTTGSLPEGMRAEEVFPHFMKTELPPVVLGLVISGILAAAMSTIDSCLNSISTLVLIDIIRPLRKRAPRIPEIWTLRLSTILFGAIGTGVAIFMHLAFEEERARTIMDLWWQYAGTAGGGLFGLFLLAWLTPRLPSWGAGFAVLSTIPVLAWGTFVRNIPAESPWAWLECPLSPLLVGVAGTATMLLVGGLLMLGVLGGLYSENPRALSQQ